VGGKPWDRIWAEMSTRARYMWLQGCRPSTALLGLSSLAHVREESISGGIKSGIKSGNALRKPLRNPPVQAMNNGTGATASTPAKAEPEPKTPLETGPAIAARRMLAARRTLPR
jgi:hypothetical protein